jgi:hypothetical protein
MFRMDCNYYNVPLFPARDRIDPGLVNRHLFRSLEIGFILNNLTIIWCK